VEVGDTRMVAQDDSICRREERCSVVGGLGEVSSVMLAAYPTHRGHQLLQRSRSGGETGTQ
jgi:hypothetical protein